jgi:hypothetical protein
MSDKIINRPISRREFIRQSAQTAGAAALGAELLTSTEDSVLCDAGTCDLRFTLQGRYASVVDLSAFGIKNTAVTIHGSALLAGTNITEDEFISVQNEEVIIDALNRYLTRNALNPGRHDLLILDMEPRYRDPNDPEKWIHFSPSNLGEYDPVMRDQLILAYIRRLSVARKVLRQKWPTVRLALYGVVVPDGKGIENCRFQKRMRGYQRAGELGMYDYTEYLVPVLYNRFGRRDVPLPNGEFDLAKLHSWIERATLQAITFSQQLTRRNGTKIPLAPILTFWVNNGNSADNNMLVLPETMGLQLRSLQAYCAVEIILFWSGAETREEMREAGYESFDFNDFLGQVEGLPPPRCR